MQMASLIYRAGNLYVCKVKAKDWKLISQEGSTVENKTKPNEDKKTEWRVSQRYFSEMQAGYWIVWSKMSAHRFSFPV